MASLTRIITAAEIEGILPIERVIELAEKALAAYATGEAETPPTQTVLLPGDAQLLAKTSWLPGQNALGTKLVTIHPGNPARGLPTTRANLAMLDPANGDLLALMDATWITNARTAATSAVAVKYLAPPRYPAVLAVIGAGPVGLAHIEAISTVCRPTEVRLAARDLARTQAIAAREQARLGIPIRAVASAAEAVRGATMIVTATTSTQPVVADADLPVDCFVAAVGSYLPHLAELERATVLRSSIWADSISHVSASSGLVQDAETRSRLEHSVGLLTSGRMLSQVPSRGVTLFISVGLAPLDILVAHEVLKATS